MKPTSPSAGPLAEGEVLVQSEGQGLSAKQKRDAAALVQKALSAAQSSPDGLFTDDEFAASSASLWINGNGPGHALQTAGVSANLVQSWKRPREFGAPFVEADGEPRLFHSDWSVQGVVASPLLNHWLLAACNIVAADVDVLERVFVDTEHAKQGFYLVRFYVDDPNSDDDWQVVLVDDQLPCGEDGLPCFGHCPSRVVLWVSIIEKAFAKFKGCYEATGGSSVEDGLLYLTGGFSREVGVVPSADPAMIDALWGQMMEWWMSAHMIGCEHRIDTEPSAELLSTGLLPNTPYCVITGGEPMGAGRMVRLRTFHGYSEWTGKWSDGDKNWTSRLKQQLAYSNADDGTFWMAFEDFVTWFNVLFVCRMADDRWTTLTTKSRWQDLSAGGCPPNFATWRCNPQWLLRTSRPLSLTVTISTPQPPAPPDGAAQPAFSPEASIGLTVLIGNAGVDAGRRKLLLTSPEELIVRADPRPVRRLVTQIQLEPSETPYILLPHTYMPGRETPFTMTIRADDADDDGAADFSLEPIRPETDWHTAHQTLVWKEQLNELCQAAAEEEEDDDDDEDAVAFSPPVDYDAPSGGPSAGGPPGSQGFEANPRLTLRVEKAGRFYVFIDQIGIDDGKMDGAFPAIGAAVIADPNAFEDGKVTLDEMLLHEQPQEADSLMFACELAAAETPYCIMPYLVDPVGALAANPQLAFRVCVYSDAPFSLGDAKTSEADNTKHGMKPDGTCICWGYGLYPGQQSQSNCIILKVYNAMKKMERDMDRQLKFLDTLTPTIVHEKMKS